MKQRVGVLFLVIIVCNLCKLASSSNVDSLENVISTDRLPFEMPSFNQVLDSPKMVLAHYFHPFPLSIDNKNPFQDYYANNYLQPSGENNKFIKQGGYLRVRPLPIFAPQNSSNIYWKLTNMEREVRMAIARGINGWSFDILSVKEIGNGTCFYTGTICGLSLMLRAVKNVDPMSRFKVVLMPDMASSLSLADIVTIVKFVYNDTAIYRLNDSRPVLAPFLSEKISPSQWQGLFQNLTDDGYPVAFMPTFLTISSTYINVEAYANISVGMGVWATVGIPTQGSSSIGYASTVRNAKSSLTFWMGMMPQTYKPKNCILYDSYNSLAYRNGWMASLQTKADINTTGTGFYDLTAFYAQWWRTGSQPKITKDVVYYFYRKEATNANAPTMGCNFTMGVVQTVSNKIEVLTFTTDISVLFINIGNSSYSFNVNMSGMNSFLVPLEAGQPMIQLWRRGELIINVTGNHYIYPTNVGLPNGVLDLTYWSGSATASITPITPIVSTSQQPIIPRNVSSIVVSKSTSIHVSLIDLLLAVLFIVVLP